MVVQVLVCTQWMLLLHIARVLVLQHRLLSTPAVQQAQAPIAMPHTRLCWQERLLLHTMLLLQTRFTTLFQQHRVMVVGIALASMYILTLSLMYTQMHLGVTIHTTRDTCSLITQLIYHSCHLLPFSSRRPALSEVTRWRTCTLVFMWSLSIRMPSIWAQRPMHRLWLWFLLPMARWLWRLATIIQCMHRTTIVLLFLGLQSPTTHLHGQSTRQLTSMRFINWQFPKAALQHWILLSMLCCPRVLLHTTLLRVILHRSRVMTVVSLHWHLLLLMARCLQRILL